MILGRELLRVIEAEVGRWHGASVRVDRRAKHPAVVLSVSGAERFVTFSGTTSDQRAVKNKIGDVRRTLRDLGAVRA